MGHGAKLWLLPGVVCRRYLNGTLRVTDVMAAQPLSVDTTYSPKESLEMIWWPKDYWDLGTY